MLVVFITMFAKTCAISARCSREISRVLSRSLATAPALINGESGACCIHAATHSRSKMIRPKWPCTETTAPQVIRRQFRGPGRLRSQIVTSSSSRFYS
jgi:hypothetical protein